MQVTRSIDVRASATEVFAELDDLREYGRFFTWIQEWRPVDDATNGQVGDVFDVRLSLAGSRAGARIEVDGRVEGMSLSWEATRGVDHRFEIVLMETGDTTNVTMTIHFPKSTSTVGRLVRAASRSVFRRNIDATLETLRHGVEWGFVGP